MFLERVYDRGLAQASFVVGCAATGEAVVVDPIRDVEPYLAIAEREGFRITHVTETHIHADYVSGARELAHRTGAKLFLSAEGGEEWQYAFASEAGAQLLRDGDSFMVGNIKIEARHTPGHTPEHLTFLVTDTPAGDEPMGAFTGDFIFVGDVGRPDLLEKAAKVQDTMEIGARQLFQSLQAFKELPDHLQIWPGHGAGSACGKSLGAVPQSTLGYEKQVNWAFQHDDEESFVRAVLEGQPDPPMYFAEMKRVNREGPDILGDREPPAWLAFKDLDRLQGTDALLVDARPRKAFQESHIPGFHSIPLGRSFSTWAGSVLPFRRPIALILPDEDEAMALWARRELEVIGLDQLEGVWGPQVVEEWEKAGHTPEEVEEISADEVAHRMENGALQVVDVRTSTEWGEGHIPGSVNVPLGRLPEGVENLPADVPLVVHCNTGPRAMVALAALRAQGLDPVLHLEGDMAGWKSQGRPVASG